MNKLTYILFLLALNIQAQEFSNTLGSGKSGFGKFGIEKGLGRISETQYSYFSECLFDRMSTEPSDNYKFAISQVIDTLYKYGIYQKADALYGFAIHDSADALLCWNNNLYDASPSGTMTFTIKQGFTSTGGGIETMCNPADPNMNWKLDTCSMAVYIRTNDLTDSKFLMGIRNSTNLTEILIRTASLQLRVNNQTGDGTYTFIHGGSITGYTCVTRDNAANIKVSRNGANYTTSPTINSNTIPNHIDGFGILSVNNSGTPLLPSVNEISFVYVGRALSQAESNILYAAWERYLDYFGKGVNP